MFKKTAILTAWTILAGLVLFAVLVPQQAVMFQSPMATLGLGIVGLGLCMHGKKQLAMAHADEAGETGDAAERHPRRPGR